VTGDLVGRQRSPLEAAEVAELQRVLARWLERDVRPHVIDLDQADVYPTEMVEQMRDFGLFGATIDPEWGGLGLPASVYAEIVAQISAVWMSLTGVLNSHLMMAFLIQRYGTDGQRADLLPRLAAGELRGGLALTEPTCGTDLQAIRTTAARDGGEYVVNGSKTWITNAGKGNCLALLVKTDPAAQPRHAGMSVLLVLKDADGYTIPRHLGKLGYRGVDTVEVVFDDVHVPAARLLGGVEGSGFAQVQGGLELGRLNVAARGVGVADAALQASLQYATARETMGKPIGQHQAVQVMLADMACRVASARLLTREAAAAIDAGRRCDLEAGMAKLVATEAALANATDALRIHGAYGFSTEQHLERYYRDAPLLCIGEGTNEIQRIVIARRLLEGVQA
jgi:alkylation response protein AidB-like acyl-CoA dehydrogenase